MQFQVARRPVRVLHLLHWLTTGGIERWVINMLEHADRNHYQLDVCCKGGSTGVLAPLAEQLGARIWHIPLDWTHGFYLTRLVKLIRNQQYDLVHNHLTVYAGVGAVAAQLAGRPSITSFHNTSNESDVLFNPWLRHARDLYGALSIPLALQLSRYVTGCSQGVVEFVKEAYRVDHTKLRALYYGVNVPRELAYAERTHVRTALGIALDAPLIVHAGRFAPQKNHSGLLAIAAEVVARHPQAIFVLLGDGPLRPRVEQEVQARGLTHHVRLLGRRDDVEAIMRSSDMLCLPSFWEGLPMVSMEAGAASLPIIASNLPGLREAIIEGETGYLLPAEATQLFAATISELINDPARRQRIGQAARARVKALFSSQASVARLCALYDECLARPQLAQTDQVPGL